jgi:hypothetical protein
MNFQGWGCHPIQGPISADGYLFLSQCTPIVCGYALRNRTAKSRFKMICTLNKMFYWTKISFFFLFNAFPIIETLEIQN